jgi:hypothetical protein
VSYIGNGWFSGAWGCPHWANASAAATNVISAIKAIRGFMSLCSPLGPIFVLFYHTDPAKGSNPRKEEALHQRAV